MSDVTDDQDFYCHQWAVDNGFIGGFCFFCSLNSESNILSNLVWRARYQQAWYYCLPKEIGEYLEVKGSELEKVFRLSTRAAAHRWARSKGHASGFGVESVTKGKYGREERDWNTRGCHRG